MLLGHAVVLVNVLCFPGVVDPGIADSDGGAVAALGHHVLGQLALLLLVLVVQDEDEEVCLLGGAAQVLRGRLDVLLELAHGVLERGPGVVDLVDNEHVLSDQVGHLQRGEVEPLGAGDLCAWDLFGGVCAERLVERETDGLDRDVGVAGLLKERAGGVVRLGERQIVQSCMFCCTGEYGQARNHHRQWRSSGWGGSH